MLASHGTHSQGPVIQRKPGCQPFVYNLKKIQESKILAVTLSIVTNFHRRQPKKSISGEEFFKTNVFNEVFDNIVTRLV